MVTLTRPGSLLATPDPQGHISGLLYAAEEDLVNALNVLSLFERTLDPALVTVGPAQVAEEEERYKKLAARLVGGLGMDILECRFAVDAMFDRERWARGQRPKRLPWRLSIVYARSFVQVLNRVRYLLEALAQLPGVPKDARAQAAKLQTRLPGLAGVRDSTEHLHERLLRRAKKGRKRATLNTPVIILSENLSANRLVSTMSNGHSGEVKISRQTVELTAAYVQAAIDALDWTGPPQVSYLG